MFGQFILSCTHVVKVFKDGLKLEDSSQGKDVWNSICLLSFHRRERYRDFSDIVVNCEDVSQDTLMQETKGRNEILYKILVSPEQTSYAYQPDR